VKIGPTDTCIEDPNLNVVDPHFGFGHILEPKTTFLAALY
jgi:hypothetical protein